MRIFLVFCLILVTVATAFGQTMKKVTVTTDTVEFVMGTGFTAEEAYNRVLARAKRQAVDQAAETYIQSYSKVENYRLTQDIIDAVHIGVVVDYKIKWKNDDAEETGEQKIIMEAIVECPSIDELRRAVDEKAPERLGVKEGDLLVTTYPEGATIFIDGDKQIHRTPYTFHDIPEGKHDITLKLEGYRPETKSVRISPADPQMVNILLQRPKGRLKITSNIKNAHARLDNKELGALPITIEDLLVGIHDLTVYSTDEYEPYTAEVEVYIDKIREIYAQLRIRPGRILVFPIPRGITVSLKETGKSVYVDESYTFRDLEPRRYTISGGKKGYSFEDKIIDLPPGKTMQVELFGTKIKDITSKIIEPKKNGKKGRKTWLYVGGGAVAAGVVVYIVTQDGGDGPQQGTLRIRVPRNP